MRPLPNTIPASRSSADEPLFLDEVESAPKVRRRETVDVGALFTDEAPAEIPQTWNEPAPAPDGRRLPTILLILLAAALGFALVAAALF